MARSKIDELLKKAQEFEQLTQQVQPEEPLGVYYRSQPVGKDLFGHTSGLAYEKVPGIFAFEDPSQLFGTYSWIHMKKNLDNYEMIKFLGKLVDKPADSEGVVVEPKQVIQKVPLRDFAKQYAS